MVLMYSEDGADKPEYVGLLLNRGCPFKEKAVVSVAHSANTAADKMSLMILFGVRVAMQSKTTLFLDVSEKNRYQSSSS